MHAEQKTSFQERHFAVSELSALWNFGEDTVRNLFIDEPGVIVISHRRRGTRVYRTLRIPESVARRVYERLLNREACA